MKHLHSLTQLVTDPSAPHAIELFALLVVVGSVGFLLCRLSPATVFSIAVGSEIFSGNWQYMHIPVPIDRLLFMLGLGILIFGGMRRVTNRRFVFSPIHLLLLAITVYVVLSALGAGTLTTSLGFYAILDRFGVIPFLMFALAPMIYRSADARRGLLVVLIVVGFYLGVTAIMEGAGLLRYVEPSYIRNPNLGIHYGRARGPFLESVADGLSMFMCGVAAAIGLVTWQSRKVRVACLATIVVCGAGDIFTLTRSIWIGSIAGMLVPALYDKRMRRYVVRTAVVLGLAIYGAIVLIPGLQAKVSSRASDASPVWDRYNTNNAALRAWEAHPIFGIGWETFVTKGPDYLRQAGSYPLTGVGLEVHNVFLSHLVELGLPAALLWMLALFSGVGGAAVRRGPDDLYAWRLGLMAILVAFLVAANLGPLSYPFPNLILWMWAGIVASERYSVKRPSDDPLGLNQERGAPARRRALAGAVA